MHGLSIWFGTLTCHLFSQFLKSTKFWTSHISFFRYTSAVCRFIQSYSIISNIFCWLPTILTSHHKRKWFYDNLLQISFYRHCRKMRLFVAQKNQIIAIKTTWFYRLPQLNLIAEAGQGFCLFLLFKWWFLRYSELKKKK